MADGTIDLQAKPTEDISVREGFGIDSDMKIKALLVPLPVVEDVFHLQAGICLAQRKLPAIATFLPFWIYRTQQA